MMIRFVNIFFHLCSFSTSRLWMIIDFHHQFQSRLVSIKDSCIWRFEFLTIVSVAICSCRLEIVIDLLSEFYYFESYFDDRFVCSICDLLSIVSSYLILKESQILWFPFYFKYLVILRCSFDDWCLSSIIALFESKSNISLDHRW